MTKWMTHYFPFHVLFLHEKNFPWLSFNAAKCLPSKAQQAAAAVAVIWTRVSLNIDKTHAGCLSSVNPGVGAAGAQADGTFHPESQPEKKQTHEGGCWHTLQERWPFATCDSVFCERCNSTVMLVNLCWQLGGGMLGLAEWVSLYFDIMFVDEYTHLDLQRTLRHSEVKPG